MHLPTGFFGWTVFATGLLIIAYRVHGIDSPRAWVESVERKFTYGTNLRLLGGILFLAAGVLGYFGGTSQTLIGLLFMGCIALLAIVGLGLLIMQNHMRHIVFASGESTDTVLRISSVIFVLIGLGLALAAFVI